MRSRDIPRPSWNLEYLMWLFTRLSGISIAVLALAAFTAAMIMGARNQMDFGTLLRWTFFPNPNHVLDSEIPDITAGWANGFWQITQMLLAFFGATHGFNGLRVVVEDYTNPGFWQLALRGLIFLLWIFTTLIAVYVILGS